MDGGLEADGDNADAIGLSNVKVFEFEKPLLSVEEARLSMLFSGHNFDAHRLCL